MKSMHRNSLNRRRFLKGIGGACLAAPFLGSVHEQWAKAAGVPAAPPKRLVIFYTHNGCLTNRWFPTKIDGPLTAADLTGSYLEVLAPHADKLLIPRGFRSLNGYAQVQTIDPHDQAMGSKLTCATITDDRNRYATAESLDHTIAKQINPNGGAPLVLGVGAASTSIKEVLSFSGPNTAFPANTNPQTVYTQLTGVLGMGGGDTGGPTNEAGYLVARGQSAIDLVREDLASYQRLNMSMADKNRIQDWLDLLRDTEIGTMNPTMTAACTTTAATTYGATAEAVAAASPTGKITPGNVLGPMGSEEGDRNLAISFTQGTDMMQNLMALNMICDQNRMLMLVFPGYIIFNWDGIEHTHEAHGLSHRTGDFTVGGACGVAGVLDMLAEIDRWYTGKYLRLVNLLASIGEGDGTLLDNTATMWLPELSDGGAHNLNNLPIVIAGSAGGYLRQGAIVNVDGGNLTNGNSEGSCQNGGNIGNTGSSGGNLPINKLYVTLMNAVGCTENGGPVTKFGVFDGNNANGGITNPGEVSSLRGTA
jgi:hypothetical protein